MGRLLRVLGVLALAAATGLACSDGDDGEGPEDGVQEIQMSGRQFRPQSVTIDPGTTVRWVGDAEPHTVTPNVANQPGVWREAQVAPGGEFEYTFNEPGQTYNYHCEVHSEMTGTITVRNNP